MIDSMILTMALAIDDREWAAQRPSRGVHSTVVRDASRIPARWRAFQRCVAQRESGGSPTARNPQSSAQGRYQFLDRLWRSSLAKQVAARLRDHGLPAADVRSVRELLSRKEIATWPAVYQDMGFIAVVTNGGAHHWRLAGSKCEAYR